MDVNGVTEEIVAFVCSAAEQYLKDVVAKLGQCAVHRIDTFRADPDYVKDLDIRAQIRFLKVSAHVACV
jgi:hypothetical protein